MVSGPLNFPELGAAWVLALPWVARTALGMESSASPETNQQFSYGFSSEFMLGYRVPKGSDGAAKQYSEPIEVGTLLDENLLTLKFTDGKTEELPQFTVGHYKALCQQQRSVKTSSFAPWQGEHHESKNKLTLSQRLDVAKLIMCGCGRHVPRCLGHVPPLGGGDLEVSGIILGVILGVILAGNLGW